MIQGSGGTEPGAVVGHDLQVWFESYLRVCNRHTFTELKAFLAPDLVVNGRPDGLDDYLARLGTIARGFPDFRWTLQQLIMNDGWLAAHCLTTGTQLGTFMGHSPSGTGVRLEEYAFYRVTDFTIREIWLTSDHLALLDQLRSNAR